MNSVRPNRRDVTLGLTAGFAAFATSLPAMALDDRVVAYAKEFAPVSDMPLMMLLPEGSQANLAPVVAAFSAQTGIEIVMEEVHVDQINTEVMLDSMMGTARYDIALPATFGLPDLADAGAIQPLDNYASKYKARGVHGDVLYKVGDQFDGQTYGFQTDGDAYVMFYHREMLEDPEFKARYEDRFGIPLSPPETWAELDRQIAFFHDPDAGRYGGLLFRTPGYLAWEWWVRFHAKGHWPFSPDMTPQIAGAAGVAALEEMIAVTRYLAPEVGTLGLFGNWARYARGDVYCNIGWGGTQKYLNSPQSAMRGRIEHGPTPGGLVRGELLRTPYFNWGWSFVVSATSTRPELAYLFSLFATSPHMSTLAVRQSDGFFDPYRPEHYDDIGVRDAYSAPFLKVQRAALEGAIPDLYLKGQSDYFQALGEGLDRALQGQVSPEVALARVAQKWELITSRAGRRAQIKRWRQLRAKYPPGAQRLLRDLA
ncbi:extracellular solute-binding protein [Sulfitobacter sp. PS-8MA]|uniref:extracellular solute-binding protein n=1 Tax=Sulfitobacter sp. PS-8MA TaxID=3237707 RepID=UPI0034C5F6EF